MRALAGRLLCSLSGALLLAATSVTSANAATAATPARPAAPATLLAADHPILGIWRLEVPHARCVETYRFRADGTSLVTSAAEVSESVFTIPARPDAKGFYRLTDRITKDNGQPDCAGNIMKPGAQVIHFIQFHPSRTLFLMCADQTMQACIGPFRRVRGEQV